MKTIYTREQITEMLRRRLLHGTDVESDILTTPDTTYYKAVSLVVRDIATEKRARFLANNLAAGKKQVYYLSMEFLLGRSLKNNLLNLGLTDIMASVLGEYDVRLEDCTSWSPTRALVTGALGGLRPAIWTRLPTRNIWPRATAFCTNSAFSRRRSSTAGRRSGPINGCRGARSGFRRIPATPWRCASAARVNEYWNDGYHHVEHDGYSSVLAVPYDINVTGYNSAGVSLLRVWRAKTAFGMDMDSFNWGDYASAFCQPAVGEVISKVLYPNDNHYEGKALRLRQQYFLCAASVADICRRHLAVYGTLSNFAEKNAIHINDTHPTLAIPEMMRFLLDDCGYGWDAAWKIVTGAFAYTTTRS
jgi:starch phosphorylase